MSSIGELVGRALPPWARRAEQPTTESLSSLPQIHDYCSCRKPEGHGSSGGFHLRRFDEGDLRREVERALSLLPPDTPEEHRAAVAEGTKRLFAPNIGMPISYERCPAYMAAVERNARTQAKPSSQRNLRLIDEDDEE